MRKCFALLILLAAAPVARGQVVDVQENLRRGQDAYEKSNVELARSLFTAIIASRQQVTPEQKVVAYKYLGAYWSLQSSPGARDSANSFFIAALDYDPFTDLDRGKFFADEQAGFARAKKLIFKVGIQPVETKALDPTSQIPDSSRYTFRVVTTHSARLSIELASLTDPTKKESFPSVDRNDGVRDVVWNGLINTQRADTGLYQLVVTATSQEMTGRPPVTETYKFRIDHFHAALEDTLFAFKDVLLGGADTLKSRYSGGRPYTDGAKGVVVAALAAALPFVVFNNRKSMSSGSSHYGVGIALGLIGGAGAAWYATSHRDDARAAAENTRRRNLRGQFNAGVIARNRARLDKTILIIRPLTSAGITG